MSTHNNSAVFQGDYVAARLIDWPLLIEDMKATGLTYTAIHNYLGVSWSTLQGWREGAEPRFSTGCLILIAHSRVCGVETTRGRIKEAPLDPERYIDNWAMTA